MKQIRGGNLFERYALLRGQPLWKGHLLEKHNHNSNVSS